LSSWGEGLVRYAQNEWERKLRLEEEEMILLNPLHPAYKRLLENTPDEEKMLQMISERLKAFLAGEETALFPDPRDDVFVMLFPLVSVCSTGGYSRETKLVIDWICETISTRLEVALRNESLFPFIKEAVSEIIEIEMMYEESYSQKMRIDRFMAISQKRSDMPDIPQEDMYRLLNSPDLSLASLSYLVRWWDLSGILRIQDLTGLYLVEGWTPVTGTMLVSLYKELLRNNLTKYVEEKKREHEQKAIALPDFFLRVAALVRSRVPSQRSTEVVSESMEEEAFPPCVRISLAGVGAGLRNFAITVFLTSFLSYARLFPSFSIFNREKKILLGEKEIHIIREEIVPQIIAAGNNCRPPLFQDNEIEKLNVFYHLGLGLSDAPTPNDFGKSKWYIPPNCEKVRQNAPSLCQPDKFCLQDFYSIQDREKFERLVETSRSRGNEMASLFSAFRKYKNAEALSERTGMERKKIESALEGLVLSKILIKRKVWNPFIYYLRKKIQMKRR
jgi:DNA primase large subunit